MLKKLTVIIFVGIILAINLALIYPYLFQDFPRFISSIEVGFITMGRWFAERLGREWWIQEWYSGIPIHLLYAPLTPLLTAILGGLLKNFGLGYHLVSGIAYILVLVSLFFFIRKLTKSDFAGL